jgi:hypothetical protein
VTKYVTEAATFSILFKNADFEVYSVEKLYLPNVKVAVFLRVRAHHCESDPLSLSFFSDFT